MPDLERCAFRSGLKLSGISESATGRKKVFCHIEVGTWIPMSGKVTEETAFRVRAFEPNHWMLWEKAASSWAWKLIPIDEEHTRLILSVSLEGWRATYPCSLTRSFCISTSGFGSLVLSRRARTTEATMAAASTRAITPKERIVGM